MTYPKEVIEEAEALIEAYRPYAYTRNVGNDETENSIKAVLVSVNSNISLVKKINLAFKKDNDNENLPSYKDALQELVQIKEYLENKLKEL